MSDLGLRKTLEDNDFFLSDGVINLNIASSVILGGSSKDICEQVSKSMDEIYTKAFTATDNVSSYANLQLDRYKSNEQRELEFEEYRKYHKECLTSCISTNLVNQIKLRVDKLSCQLKNYDNLEDTLINAVFCMEEFYKDIRDMKDELSNKMVQEVSETECS